VSSDGLRPDPDKVKEIRELRYLQNISELRSSVALLSYFKKFIQFLLKYQSHCLI
jgi:hypothetical protein